MEGHYFFQVSYCLESFLWLSLPTLLFLYLLFFLPWLTPPHFSRFSSRYISYTKYLLNDVLFPHSSPTATTPSHSFPLLMLQSQLLFRVLPPWKYKLLSSGSLHHLYLSPISSCIIGYFIDNKPIFIGRIHGLQKIYNFLPIYLFIYAPTPRCMHTYTCTYPPYCHIRL